MCFRARKSVKERIADRDIHVQKVFRKEIFGKIRSPFYCSCYWEIGETKQAQIETSFIDELRLLEINEGLHSAKCIKRYANSYGNWFGTNKGNLCWVCDDDTDMIVCDCIIPKGSIYYKNSENMYVSNCLKLVKEIVCETIIV